MEQCDGHRVVVKPDGLQIDGQFYSWDELLWQNGLGIFVSSQEDLSDRMVENLTILQYDSQTIDLSKCPNILGVVRQHV